MPTLVACLWRRVEAIQLGRVPTHFGPATRLRRPESQWNQGALATSQVEMCPRTANSGLVERVARGEDRHPAHQHLARLLPGVLEPPAVLHGGEQRLHAPSLGVAGDDLVKAEW